MAIQFCVDVDRKNGQQCVLVLVLVVALGLRASLLAQSCVFLEEPAVESILCTLRLFAPCLYASILTMSSFL